MSYWRPKLARNVERDREVDHALSTEGWIVLRIWEHEPLDLAVTLVEEALKAAQTGRPPPTWGRMSRMLTSAQAWEALASEAPRGEWLSITQLYEIVERNVSLEEADARPISTSNSSPRWKRTVRNALQRRKALGQIEWDGSGRYRIPT